MVCPAVSLGKISALVHRIKVIALTTFFVIASPILLIFLWIVYCYRRIVNVSAKCFRPDLHRQVPTLSSIFACDDRHGIPDWNIVACFILRGHVCIEILQNLVQERVANLTETDGHYVYPELRQFPYRWNSFWFWKWDAQFDLMNHVFLYEKSKDTHRYWNEQDLGELQRNLIRKQWVRNRSPWEILLVHNFKPKSAIPITESQSVVFLRYHQCLGDGYTWMNLLANELCGGPIQIPQNFDCGRRSSMVFRRSLCNRIADLCLLPFQFCFYFAREVLEPEDKSAWKFPENELIKRDHMMVLERFSKQFIRDIRILNEVSFTAVTLAAISGAIRVTMLELGLEVPVTMRVSIPIPIVSTGHTEKLDNKMTTCFIKLPVGIANAGERLLSCERNLDEIKASALPYFYLWRSRVLGSLPLRWSQKMIKYRHFVCTGGATNFPGPDTPLKLMGHDVEDFTLSCASDTGFQFSFLSYAETMRITIVMDERVMPTDMMANKLVKNLYNELVTLGGNEPVA